MAIKPAGSTMGRSNMMTGINRSKPRTKVGRPKKSSVKTKTSRKSSQKLQKAKFSADNKFRRTQQKQQYKLAKGDQKIRSRQAKYDLTPNTKEVELAKLKTSERIALAGEAGSTVAGTVAPTAIAAINKQVDGGISNSGGLGREEALQNSKPSKPTEDKDGKDWSDVIGGLGY